MASPEPRGFSVRLGATFPLLETASGLVLLAFAEPARQEAVLHATVPKRAHPETRRRLEQVRTRGRYRARSQTLAGIIDLSYPVLDHTGVAIAALTMPYLVVRGSRHDVAEAEQQLHQAATALTEAIGGGGANP